MKPPRGRRTKREEIQLRNATHAFYARAAPNAERAAEGLRKFTQAVPRKRRPAVRDPSKRYEADVLRDILSALRKHPRVARVERRQSGVFRDGERWIGVGRRGDPDITGILKGGRAFAIEVKRPGEEPNELQARRLEEIKAAGGVAGCAHSVEEAHAIVDSA